ncbi:MAG: MBL fold metallo-hydrolase [Spirochaetaceae bacterium]|jgi:glyoxylase-like metal-dependent hydrolase (beta-lactamase superfamily II)|nr:MBL fold metallo-hydrolase [Spirochaetaceae bacterium]
MNKKIVFGLVLSVMAAGVYADESDGIFSFRVGQFEVYMLVETQREGNAGILIGADGAVLKKYIPSGSFFHSTNTFLIKAPGRNILVDTGFGGAVFDKIKKLGVEAGKIDAVLLTHMHGDHIGGLQKDGKALFPNAKIYLASRELEYWTKTNVNQGAVAALAPYGSRVETFEPGKLGSKLKEILPGISPIAAYGHTPGHTVFLVENSGAKLIIWGDLLHVALVQFPVPEISASYDMDTKAAARIRRQVFDYAAKNKIPGAGMHQVFPGVGTVEKDGKGFRFVPANIPAN